MSTVSAAWVLAALRVLAPSSPYAETFDATAEAIARQASAAPLFAGPDGARKTAALLASVGWYESSLNPAAEGDCLDKRKADGTCAPGGTPTSYCLLQVNRTNLAMLGTTRAELVGDVDACVRAGLAMMRQSLAICRALPLEERLSWYAGGGPSCATPSEDAKRKSRHRMGKARWLFDHVKDAA